MTTKMKIAVAQLNPTVGDLKGNSDKIFQAWQSAKDQGADLVMTTEFSLTGYPLEDLVEIKDFLKLSDKTLKDLAQKTSDGPALLVGAPFWQGEDKTLGRQIIYNAVFYLKDGEINQTIKKVELPNYGVFDEKRNFMAGPLGDVQPVELNGHKIGVMICEDTWLKNVSGKLAERGAEILLSLNASPFEQGKYKTREDKIVKSRAAETGLDVIYSNQVGGQDELVFDGGSFALSAAGEKIFQAPVMREDLTVLEGGRLGQHADERCRR